MHNNVDAATFTEASIFMFILSTFIVLMRCLSGVICDYTQF